VIFVAGGAAGFKLVGLVLGALVHSQPLGLAMGAYGASSKIYPRLLSRGLDLGFTENTAMSRTIGTRPENPKAAQEFPESEPKS